MIEIIKSPEFTKWLHGLKDGHAKIVINKRLLRLKIGHLGDVKPVGDGISEVRIHYGPGYRLYCIRKGKAVIVMLGGGNKSSQSRDIKRAKQLADYWR